MRGLLDTNVALYLLGGRLASPLPEDDYGVSVITEMELLSWPGLSVSDEGKVRQFLDRMWLFELTAEVRQRAIQLRREERLKLPDAIICATAILRGVDLWTNDARLHQVRGLNCQKVALVNG